MTHHLVAKQTTDAILAKFKAGVWQYGGAYGVDFIRTGVPAVFPSPDAAFYDPANKVLAYFEFKPDTENKRGILTGIGQSIAYLQQCNLSYLIAPKRLSGFNLEGYLDNLYRTQLSHIPTGLITYDNGNPSNVSLVRNVTSLTGPAASPRKVAVGRFWAKHQDLPIPLFHLILHYYYLGKAGSITGDPFAACFTERLISDTAATKFTAQKVLDITGAPIKTVAGEKDIVFLEKILDRTAALPAAARSAAIAHQIDTAYTGDNYYNSIRKNCVTFMKHVQMVDSKNELTDLGFAMYHPGIANGPTSKHFYDYFIKVLLTVGHHLDIILDYDAAQKDMPGKTVDEVLRAMEAGYEARGLIKRNPGRKAAPVSKVRFLKYERILWKALGLMDSDDIIQWKKVTEICSLPELI